MSLNPAFYCVCWRCTRQGIMGTAVNKAASREGYQQMAHKYSCSVGLQPVKDPEAWCSPGSPVAPTAGASWMHLPPSWLQLPSRMLCSESTGHGPDGTSLHMRTHILCSQQTLGPEQCTAGIRRRPRCSTVSFPTRVHTGQLRQGIGSTPDGLCGFPFHVGRNRLGSGWLSGGVA